MFGDAASGALGFQALAGLNPLRWSGSLTFEKALADMDHLLKEKQDRPVNIKIPSGVSTKEKQLSSIQDAIEYIKSKSPEHIAAELAAANAEKKKELLKKAVENKREEVAQCTAILEESRAAEQEAKKQVDEALATAGKAQSEKCKWMFGDAGSGMGSLGMKLAHLNPIRWSSARTFDKAKSELEELVKHAEEHSEAQRPIVLKVIHGKVSHDGGKEEDGEQQKYESAQDAINFLLKTLEGDKDSATSALENSYEDAKAHTIDAEIHLAEWKAALVLAEQKAKEEGALEEDGVAD